MDMIDVLHGMRGMAEAAESGAVTSDCHRQLIKALRRILAACRLS